MDVWQGPRESTQMPGWRHMASGGWHVKGLWVSGPWLDSWGGNANALDRPTFYTHQLLSFSPCGTMFPLIFSLQYTRQNKARQMQSKTSKMHRSRGLPSIGSPSEHVHYSLPSIT